MAMKLSRVVETQDSDMIKEFSELWSEESTERLEGIVDSILEKDGKIARMRIRPTEINLSEHYEDRRITLLFQGTPYKNCSQPPVRTQFELGDRVKVIGSRMWHGENMQGVPAILNKTSGYLYTFIYNQR